MQCFEGNGISLHKRDGKYYMRYLAGEIACWMVEIAISPEDAAAVQVSPERASLIVSKYRNRCIAETGRSWRDSDFLSAEEMRKEGYIVPDGACPPRMTPPSGQSPQE